MKLLTDPRPTGAHACRATQTPRPRTQRAGLVLLALCLAACSPEAVPAANERSALRPELVLAETAERPTARVLTRLVPDAQTWNVEGNSVEPTSSGAVRLVGTERASIVIPGPFELGELNRIAVHFASQLQITFRAAFRTQGGGTLPAPDYVFTRSSGDSPARLSFPGASGTYDELLLIADSRAEDKLLDWSLIAIELEHEPLECLAPLVEDEPALVKCGSDARVAVGLSSARPLSCTTTLAKGTTLRIAVARPRRFGELPASAVLAIEVWRADETLALERFPLPAADADWSVLELDCSAWSGAAVRFEFRLETPDESNGLVALAMPRIARELTEPESVLLITSDTHRADHVGGGAGRARTPTLERFAARAVRFDDCYASSNITIPSHVALFTGVHPRTAGITNNQTPLAQQASTLAEHFRAAGYTTLAVVSVRHLRPDWSGLGQGFDRMTWPTERDHTARESIDTLLAWLPEVADERVFVWLHVFDAHRPYAPPAEFAEPYYPATRDPFAEIEGARPFPAPPGHNGLRDIEWVRAQYAGEISYLDAQLARVIELPRFKRGITALTADHGESLGEHDIYWNHIGLYPDMLAVPLMIATPNGERGVRRGLPTRQWDVGHTLLKAAGLPTAAFPGRDLLGAPPASEPLFAISSWQEQAAIRHGKWLLLLTLEEFPRNRDESWGVFKRHSVELYDLELDPLCNTNLVQADRERARTLRARLADWLAAEPTGTLVGSSNAGPSPELLAELGYASGSQDAGAFDRSCRCAECRKLD